MHQCLNVIEPGHFSLDTHCIFIYFLGLSLGNSSKTIKPFEERICVATWYWIQEFNPKNVLPNKNSRMTAFITCETVAQIGDTDAWIWVATYPIHRKIFGVCIPGHRNMLVAEAFLGSLVKLYGKHIVCSDGRTWCPEACSSLGLTRILHSLFEKGIMERAVESVEES
jgi:transposase-like protein